MAIGGLILAASDPVCLDFVVLFRVLDPPFAILSIVFRAAQPLSVHSIFAFLVAPPNRPLSDD